MLNQNYVWLQSFKQNDIVYWRKTVFKNNLGNLRGCNVIGQNLNLNFREFWLDNFHTAIIFSKWQRRLELFWISAWLFLNKQKCSVLWMFWNLLLECSYNDVHVYYLGNIRLYCRMTHFNFGKVLWTIQSIVKNFPW